MNLSRGLTPLLLSLVFFVSSGPAPGGEAPTPHPTFANERSDINLDHVVNAEDLLIFMQDWEKVTGPEKIITIDLPGLPEGARPMRLVRIPAGTFEMGSPDTERGRIFDEGPVHTVTLTNDFYMGETEVTQGQWQAIMGNNPANSYGVGNDYPIYEVSWDAIMEADGFFDRLNALGQGTFRLPSEAEWEYACRAGTTTRFSFGDILECDDGCGECALANQSMWWCGNNLPYGTKPVAGKPPNAFGLFDMHGSMWEWCQDWFQADFYSQPGATQPNPLCTDPASGTRVRRGGLWNSEVRTCRSAVRSGTDPGYGGYHLGLRVVLPASP